MSERVVGNSQRADRGGRVAATHDRETVHSGDCLGHPARADRERGQLEDCLLYTSDAADE